MNDARVHESVLSFACEGEQLVGVLSRPADMASDLALLVVVGGPQVRTGSHRQFTTLCRAIAMSGVPALRFDVRGMGDSSGSLHTFERIGPDIGAALDTLQATLPQVRRVVLWGLCDGASAALMYTHERIATRGPDQRVTGLVLINPWVRSSQTLARAHVKHYYWDRLRQGEFWRKLLRGNVARQATRDLLGNLRAAFKGASPTADVGGGAAATPFQDRMLRGAETFSGPVLWVLSGRDYTAKEFAELAATSARWQAALGRPSVSRLDVPEADHTFSKLSDGHALATATAKWMKETMGAPAA